MSKPPAVPAQRASAPEPHSQSNRILVIDDDVELCELVAEYLGAEGYAVEAVHDGVEGLQKALNNSFALVILDVMLPGIKGFQALRQIRNKSQVPVIMLTARGDFVDRILGFEIGADDYLPKPFNPRELVVRIQAVLRRTSRTEADDVSGPLGPLVVGDLQLDKSARLVRRGDRDVELTGVEFDLLCTLLESAGQVMQRDELVKAVLGRELAPFDRSIDVHVSNLRRKLGPTLEGRERIQAVRGVGYVYAVESRAKR
jgi:two-component system response regulator CpxR